MRITEKRLRNIIRNIIKEETDQLNSKNKDVVAGVIAAIKQAQYETVTESSVKDIVNSAADIGFRLFSFKATIPMIASAIILYCNHKGIAVDQLTVDKASSIVDFINLSGNGAVELVINIIAGLGGTAGMIKGSGLGKD